MSTRMGDFGVTDYTALMALAPRSQNFLQELGLFGDFNTEYSDSRYGEFEREEKGITTMHNVARGADRQFAGSESSRKEIIEIPYATLDTSVKPSEVEAFREYGTADAPASVSQLVNRKVAHIQRSHARYIRNVMYTALVNNRIHAVNAAGAQITTLAKNFSTLWGAARQTGTIDLTDAATDPFDVLETQRQAISLLAGDDSDSYQMLYICNTTQFSRLTGHARVRAAYENYSSDQEPLRRRLGGDRINKFFTHKGITIVEDVSGQISNTQGFMLPLGIEDMWQLRYAPAHTLDHVNQVSEGSYLFMVEGWRQVGVESEVAVAAVLCRPELVADITATLV